MIDLLICYSVIVTQKSNNSAELNMHTKSSTNLNAYLSAYFNAINNYQCY